MKIEIILTIGLWIPVIFFASSLVDNEFICNIFWEDDEDNNLNRCYDGESQFGFIIIMFMFLMFALSATRMIIKMERKNDL